MTSSAPAATLWPALAPFVLLSLSNVFMTLAWYGHLRFPQSALWAVIVVSWGIALIEYAIAVPANRIGAQVWSPAQLKTIQEVITLIVFVIFAWIYFGERPTWNHAIGFALIAGGAGFIFLKPL